MKRSILTVLTVMALGATFAASAAQNAIDAQERCFAAHSMLMEKPALKNLAACWRVHGYLMGLGK